MGWLEDLTKIREEGQRGEGKDAQETRRAEMRQENKRGGEKDGDKGRRTEGIPGGQTRGEKDREEVTSAIAEK